MSIQDVMPWVQYSELLDHLTTALIVLENDVVAYANAAAARITGRKTPSELVGLNLSWLPTSMCPSAKRAKRCVNETFRQFI